MTSAVIVGSVFEKLLSFVLSRNLELLLKSEEKRKKLGENAKITGIKYFNYKEAVKLYLE